MSSAGAVLSLLGSLDRLFEQAVTDPDRWTEEELALAAGEMLDVAPDLDKDARRLARRGLRQAVRLRRYWVERAGPAPADWRVRVDEALGSRAWETGLELARLGLAADLDPQLFEEVKQRFRAARFQEWMEGVGFDEWVARHRAGGD